jgi:hypothetical protein
VTAPMLKVTGLWRKTSGKGNEYFVGRFGSVKVIILENRQRNGENEPSHHLFFVDGEKPRAASAPAQSAAAGSPTSSSMSRCSAKSGTSPMTIDTGDEFDINRIDGHWRATREPRPRAPYPAHRQAAARPPIQPDQPGIIADDPLDDIGRGGAP